MNGVPEVRCLPETRTGRDFRRPRPRWLRRIAIAWLLSVTAATAAGAAGGLLDRTDHSCCPKNAVRAAAPPAPCQALLPLACCDDTTLPAMAPTPPDRSVNAFALVVAPPQITPDPRVAALLAQHISASSPRSSPLALSVTLQI